MSIDTISDSSIVSNDMASHTLRLISMFSHLSRSGCSNLCSIGCIEMITYTSLPVAIEGDCSSNSMRKAKASDSFADVSILSSCLGISGPDFSGISCVKMVTNECSPVAIKRNCSFDLTGVKKTLRTF